MRLKSVPLPPSSIQPRKPSNPRDTWPDFEDDDDDQLEEDLSSIGDGEDEPAASLNQPSR